MEFKLDYDCVRFADWDWDADTLEHHAAKLAKALMIDGASIVLESIKELGASAILCGRGERIFFHILDCDIGWSIEFRPWYEENLFCFVDADWTPELKARVSAALDEIEAATAEAMARAEANP